MGDLVNQFSWSFTRHKRFHECRRAYWYAHYGSWGGWDREAPDAARLAYLLKQMTGLDMWGGSIVHDVVETALQDLRWGRLVTVEELKRRARERMVRQWRESKSKEWEFDPKRRFNLFEHYYADPTVDARSVTVRERVDRCLENFRRSKTYAELQGVKRNGWVAVEVLEKFPVGGDPVWVKVDCAFRSPDHGGLVIVDWKTGKRRDEHRQQLECYALQAVHKLRDIEAEDVTLRAVYLDEGGEVDLLVTRDDLAALEAFIASSMAEMKAALSDVPANVARQEDFPMTTDLRTCGRCGFRELCGFGPVDGGGAPPADDADPGE